MSSNNNVASFYGYEKASKLFKAWMPGYELNIDRSKVAYQDSIGGVTAAFRCIRAPLGRI
jgi:hypothetical protein